MASATRNAQIVAVGTSTNHQELHSGIYREPARAWGCKSGTSAKFRGGLRRNPRSRSAERPRYARSGPDECLKARGRVRAIGANVHCSSHRSLSCCNARRQCEKRHIALRSTKPDGSWSSMPRSRGWLMRPHRSLIDVTIVQCDAAAGSHVFRLPADRRP